MVKSGSFKVSQGSLAGRIGAGLGKGLGEQLPKEAERYRLSQGLKQFEQEAQGLTPLQQYTRLLKIPGIQPQAIQQLPEILKQQNYAQAFANRGNEVPQVPAFPERPSQQGEAEQGLTTTQPIEATLENYIPPTQEQILAEAKQEFGANPAFFKNDPQNAIQFVQQKYQNENARNEAFQTRRGLEQNVANTIRTGLQQEHGLLNNNVPGDVYSDIETKAINSVIPKSKGGEGLTEEQARKKYGNELRDISKEYSKISALGQPEWSWLSPNEMMRNFKSIRQGFKERDDRENLANKLIGTTGLSPSKAYLLTYPPSEIPELNKTLSKIPDVNPVVSSKKGHLETKQTDYNPEAILNQIMPKLLKDMGKEGSPLAIAEELSSKGYDPSTWLKFLDTNRKKLTGEQAEQLSQPRSWFPNLNDLYLFKLSNQDKYVE